MCPQQVMSPGVWPRLSEAKENNSGQGEGEAVLGGVRLGPVSVKLEIVLGESSTVWGRYRYSHLCGCIALKGQCHAGSRVLEGRGQGRAE